MKVVFDYGMIEENKVGVYACFDDHYKPYLKGLVETGETEQQAFDELMKSLLVKIAHDNEMNVPNFVTPQTNSHE